MRVRAAMQGALLTLAVSGCHKNVPPVAAMGSLVVEGAWVWRWKDRLDRKFMDRFRLQPLIQALRIQLYVCIHEHAARHGLLHSCGKRLHSEFCERTVKLPIHKFTKHPAFVRVEFFYDVVIF
mgnify:CR=1 FL=1